MLGYNRSNAVDDAMGTCQELEDLLKKSFERQGDVVSFCDREETDPGTSG
jgi:hypothetical protein